MITAFRLATEIGTKIEAQGFAVIEDVLPSATIDQLLLSLEQVGVSDAVRRREGVFAVRNLLDVSDEIRRFANSEPIRSLIEPVLGKHFMPVRGILFDKVPGANWKVPWHQDLTIAVKDRVEAEGFGPWSIKADIIHVQPPPSVLEQMLTVRIHLDPCGEDNGALRVLPTTHRKGRIPEEDIAKLREEIQEEVCAVGRGGVLLMRPLLLHASSSSRNPGHRRVIHIDFAAAKLPSGLRWSAEQAA